MVLTLLLTPPICLFLSIHAPLLAGGVGEVEVVYATIIDLNRV